MNDTNKKDFKLVRTFVCPKCDYKTSMFMFDDNVTSVSCPACFQKWVNSKFPKLVPKE